MENIENVPELVDADHWESLLRLARAAEYKEKDTGPHLDRICLFSVALARRLGFDQQRLALLFCAAALHDVGKIGIPDRILLKPTRLVEWEWKIVKQHTTIGKRILEDAKSPILNLGEVIAYTHHEMWDGNGYPRGLKGEETPLEARIVSLADVFDVLTSERPYKESMCVEEAFRTVLEAREKEFDPLVVDAFSEVREEMLTIKSHHIDRDETVFLQMADRDRV